MLRQITPSLCTQSERHGYIMTIMMMMMMMMMVMMMMRRRMTMIVMSYKTQKEIGRDISWATSHEPLHFHVLVYFTQPVNHKDRLISVAVHFKNQTVMEAKIVPIAHMFWGEFQKVQSSITLPCSKRNTRN